MREHALSSACPECGGTGQIARWAWIACLRCRGRGRLGYIPLDREDVIVTVRRKRAEERAPSHVGPRGRIVYVPLYREDVVVTVKPRVG